MLTLRRFRTMADSYGADLLRWPDGARAEAQALLKASPAARALLDEARTLDDAIEAAGTSEDAVLWEPDGQDAAMARLRSGVEARIAASAERRPSFRRTGWALALHTRWVGMATGGGFAIMAGLLIGAMYTSDPATDSVLTLLQPAPIHVWAD
jgi:hypothetical protein